jgi:murein DD-endopeptidase MepM/ murein hydrolase activator NlpD
MAGFAMGALLAGAATWAFCRQAYGNHEKIPAEAFSVAPPHPAAVFHTETVSIKSGDTFSNLLLRAGVDESATTALIAAVQETFDVRALRAGSQLQLTRSGLGSVATIEYVIDPDRKLKLSQSGDSFEAAILEVPGSVRVMPVCGTIEGSLFESIDSAGEGPELAIRMAEIFAWDLDFYTDPRQGDEFCLLVEKKEYGNGQPPTYGRILAAKYNNAGETYDAFLFPDEEGKPRFYSHDGRSLQAAFLRSPMKFEARVSSRFSRRRFHPVLKRYRPHLGTDYAAPTGTPVQSVAAGRVVFSGRSGGAGNLVRIKHSGGYETYYMHLSRRYVRTGQHVQQGQRIGAVGATGLATGPHLDFRVRKNGAFVNFERLRLPRDSRIRAGQESVFAAARDKYKSLMEPDKGPTLASIVTGISARKAP